MQDIRFVVPTTTQSKNPDMIIDNEIGEIKHFGFDGKIPTKKYDKIEIRKPEENSEVR